MPLLTTLLLLLVAARLLGELSSRLRQPAIIGEILAGAVLGPSLLGIVQPSDALTGISELAVFLIIMASGLEMDFSEVVANLRGRGFLVAVTGFVLPLLAGIGLGGAFHLDPMRMLFLGLSLSITALPVALRLLDSLQMMQTVIARYTIGAAIFSDIAALLVLGIILRLPESLDFASIADSVGRTAGKLLVFAAAVLLINYVLRTISSEGHRLHRIKEKVLTSSGAEALFGVTTLFVLAFSSVSEMLGLHAVVGAFFGALLLSHDLLGRKRFAGIQQTANSVSTGFLAPLFFAALGLQINLKALASPVLAVSVIGVAIVSKVLAGWLGGSLVGLSPTDSLKMGAMLNGRGVMGIVVADIAFQRNFIGQGLFSLLVLMSILTTAATPLMIRWLTLRQTAKNGAP